jgi:hypothetical protein
VNRRFALIAPIVLCVVHALLFTGYFLDDAYISFRYARHLAGGLGLTFNAGEQVEGYTNFAWVLLLAAGERMGIPSALLAPPLGLICLIGLIVTTVRLTRSLAGPLSGPLASAKAQGLRAGVIAGSIVAVFSGTAFYGTTGLETILFAWLCALALHACVRRQALRLAGWSLLAVLTRPEGALVACLCLARLWLASRERGAEHAAAHAGGRPSPRRLGAACALLGAGVGGYLAFKLSYFGGLLPNTFHAKTPDPISGLRYVATAAWPLLGIAVWAAVRARGEARVVAALFVPCVAAVAWEGGDWMPAGRLLVPFVPWIGAAADASLWTALTARARPFEGHDKPQLGFASAIAALLMFAVPQAVQSSRLAASSRNTVQADEARAEVFRGLLNERVHVVAAHDIGLLGEVMRDAVIVDLGGLVDREIGRLPGGYGAKHPSAEYLERRRPDAVLLAGRPPRPDTPDEIELLFEVESRLLTGHWLHQHYRHAGAFLCGDRYALHVFRRKELLAP